MTAVYFIECVESGHVKVGASRNVPQRLAAIQAHNPFTINLLATVPVEETHQIRDTQLVERRFHERYLPHHHRSEWFWNCPLIMADVAAINAGTFDPESLPTNLTQASLLRQVPRGPRFTHCRTRPMGLLPITQAAAA